jgi:hypothetical protein
MKKLSNYVKDALSANGWKTEQRADQHNGFSYIKDGERLMIYPSARINDKFHVVTYKTGVEHNHYVGRAKLIAHIEGVSKL